MPAGLFWSGGTCGSRILVHASTLKTAGHGCVAFSTTRVLVRGFDRAKWHEEVGFDAAVDLSVGFDAVVVPRDIFRRELAA